MSDAKQTPGPWAWQKFGAEWCLTGQHGMRPIVLSVSGRSKAALTSLVEGRLVPLDPQHPDARLIAAAPDLLQALEAMTALYVDLANSGDAGFWDPEKNEEVIKSRAAMLKAERKA